jgi:hypothetical protein
VTGVRTFGLGCRQLSIGWQLTSTLKQVRPVPVRSVKRRANQW